MSLICIFCQKSFLNVQAENTIAVLTSVVPGSSFNLYALILFSFRTLSIEFEWISTKQMCFWTQGFLLSIQRVCNIETAVNLKGNDTWNEFSEKVSQINFNESLGNWCSLQSHYVPWKWCSQVQGTTCCLCSYIGFEICFVLFENSTVFPNRRSFRKKLQPVC